MTGYYRGIRTKIVQSVIAAALLFMVGERMGRLWAGLLWSQLQFPLEQPLRLSKAACRPSLCASSPIICPCLPSPQTLAQAKEKITDFVRDVLLAPPAAKGCKVAVVA